LAVATFPPLLQVTEHAIPTDDLTVMCKISSLLISFWEDLGPLLEQVQKKTAEPQLLEDLQVLAFSGPEMLGWLSGTVKVVSASLFKACQDELASAWSATDKLQTLLGQLPDPASEEEKYRSQGAKLTKQIADAVAEVGKNEKMRLKMVPALKQLAGSGLPGKPAENGFNDLFQKFQGGEDGFNAKVLTSCASGSVHVAMVAGLCLLRNPSLGSANDEGRMISKQLEGVATALQSKIHALKLSADPQKELLEKAEAVVEEIASSQQAPEAAKAAKDSGGPADAAKAKKKKEEKAKDKDKDKKAKKEEKEKSSKKKKGEAKEEGEAKAAEPPAKRMRGKGK